MAEAVCPEPRLLRDLLYLMLLRTWDGTTLAAPLPKGPKLFVTNHQINLDLSYLVCWIAAHNGELSKAIGWGALRFMHHGQVMERLLARPEHRRIEETKLITPVYMEKFDPKSVSDFISELLTKNGDSNVVVCTEGTRQAYCNQPIEKPGMSLIEQCAASGRMIVPVRFRWALPEHHLGHRWSWPYLMAPLHIAVGEAIDGEAFSRLTLKQRRSLICNAINGLWRPAPGNHRRTNLEMNRRIWSLMKNFGMSQTKALVIDILITADPSRLSVEGQAVRSYLIDRQGPLADRAGWLRDFSLYLLEGLSVDLPFITALYLEHRPSHD